MTNAINPVRAALSAPVSAYVKSEVAFTLASSTIVDDVARTMGTEPKFEHWELVADAFKDEYKAAREKATGKPITDERAANVWSIIATQLKEKYSLEKPAKASADAKKKAAQRKQKDAALKQVRAQCLNAPDAMQKAAQAAQEGKANEARLFREAAMELQKEQESKARAIAKETLGKLRKELADALKACEDAKQLAEALAILKAKPVAPAKQVRAVKKEKTAA